MNDDPVRCEELGGHKLKMYEEFNELITLMNRARKEADEANRIAYELRQESIKKQFQATAAAEMAALTADFLNECKDPALLAKIAATSREAMRKTIDCTETAACAVLKANKADERVTKAFLECKEAALKLTIALDELELIE